jgi:hypothetical protein
VDPSYLLILTTNSIDRSTMPIHSNETPHVYRGLAIKTYPAVSMSGGSVKTHYRLCCELDARVLRAGSWSELKMLIDTHPVDGVRFG